ncbi:MAG TPA: SAM-dependent methyltransferase [Devosia sp.]|nr:SAM-dependent methyltransferase [Devosia sp.]
MNSSTEVFDKNLLATRFARRNQEDKDFVTQLVIKDLGARLSDISRQFSSALIIGPDAAHLPKELRSALAPIDFQRASTFLATPGFPQVNTEAFEPEKRNYDLIVSLFDIGVTNDVPGFLKQALRHLAPDGLFMAAFVGGVSLQELRSAWLEADAIHMNGAVARVAPFIDTRDAGGLLQRAGFALPVADVETHTIRYAAPLELMVEIKAFGASNPLARNSSKLVTPAHLASACRAYEQAFSDPDGRVRATLEIVWMSGWAPHESQQKPLAPGSAKVSLTKVLGKGSGPKS